MRGFFHQRRRLRWEHIVVAALPLLLWNSFFYNWQTTSEAIHWVSQGSSLLSLQEDISLSVRRMDLDPIIYQPQQYTDNSSNIYLGSARQDGDGYSHCFFRDYSKPDIHTGLPFVAEVFTSHDGNFVYLAAESRRKCQKKYDVAHDFFATETRPGVQFNCIFESDGTIVRSKPVHKRSRWGGFFILVECPIPAHLQMQMPRSGALRTQMHLTLESLQDLESGEDFLKTGKPLPKFSHLPICSNIWPSESFKEQIGAKDSTDKRISATPSTKRKISIMTRMSIDYVRGDDHQSLSLNQRDFVTWVEYHLAIGIEHFYIYDDSPKEGPEKSIIRSWCRPYEAKGVLTYVYYPYEDIQCDPDRMHGKIMYTGQLVSSNAALRRFQGETEWMGHWDIDEYLVIKGVNSSTDLSLFLDDKDRMYFNRNGVHVDEIGFARPTYGLCERNVTERSNFVSSNDMLPFERKKCLSTAFVQGKGIFRAATVLSFRVHYGQIRMDNRPVEKARVRMYNKNQNQTTGHIAHFREGEAAGTEFPKRSNAFLPWIQPIRERVDQQMSQATAQ